MQIFLCHSTFEIITGDSQDSFFSSSSGIGKVSTALGKNHIKMASLTRSGRLYAPPEAFPEASVEPMLSPKTECPPEIETPVEDKDVSTKNNNEYESITVELFDYCTSYEETCLPSNLMSPDSTFKYSSPSESESEISAGFGGWQISQQKDVHVDNKKSPASPANCVPSPPLLTVPRYPPIPRNSYGGIRDCLPPEQLANWMKVTSKPKVVPETPELSAIDLQGAPSPRTFTAEQMLHMEQNKVKALERLRASSQQTKTQATLR